MKRKSTTVYSIGQAVQYSSSTGFGATTIIEVLPFKDQYGDTHYQYRIAPLWTCGKERIVNMWELRAI